MTYMVIGNGRGDTGYIDLGPLAEDEYPWETLYTRDPEMYGMVELDDVLDVCETLEGALYRPGTAIDSAEELRGFLGRTGEEE